MIARLMARPMPMPEVLVVTNDSNKRSASCARMPGPLSRTSTRSMPALSAAMRRLTLPLLPPGSAARDAAALSIAFISRLRSTTSICTTSTSNTATVPSGLRVSQVSTTCAAAALACNNAATRAAISAMATRSSRVEPDRKKSRSRRTTADVRLDSSTSLPSVSFNRTRSSAGAPASNWPAVA